MPPSSEDFTIAARQSTTAISAAVAVGLTVAGTRAGRRRLGELQAWRHARAMATPDDVGATYETVTLTSTEGTSLHAWWIPGRDESAPAVIGVHGFASHAGDLVPLIEVLRDTGSHVLLLDLRGHGRSEPTAERPRPPSLAQDVRVAVDWLTMHEDVTSIGLVGHSMGGSTSIIAAADDPRVQAVVSVAGVADPTLSRIGWWPASVSRVLLRTVSRRAGSDPRSTFAVARIASVTAPILLIHGDRDQVVPIAHSRALAAARPGTELITVRGAGHASFEAFGPAMGQAVSFLRASLDA